MNPRSRIFDLIFPDRRRARGEDEESQRKWKWARRRRRKGDAGDGYDPRYFIRHQR